MRKLSYQRKPFFIYALFSIIICCYAPVTSQRDNDGTSAGDEINPAYGKVVIIGDSLLDGRGSTEGMVENTLSDLLETIVDNNAIGGYTLDDIADSEACSDDDQCTQWSVLNGGINGNKLQAVEKMIPIVERELEAGKKVIITGYLEDCGGYASGPAFTAFMDGYATLASGTEDVWFIDPRNLEEYPLMGQPCNPASNKYFADDNSHPSPLSGSILASEMASIILDNSSPTTSPPSVTPAPCKDDEDWMYMDKTRKNCDWVGKRPRLRCRLRSDSGVPAYEACNVSCRGCSPEPEPEIIDINWTAGFSDPSARYIEIPTPGSTLNFQWQGYHNVYMFPDQVSFVDCNFTTATKLAIDSPYRHTLEESLSDFYFACGVDAHCKEGQKLHAAVVSSESLHIAREEEEGDQLLASITIRGGTISHVPMPKTVINELQAI